MGSEQFLQIGTLIAGRYEVMKCLGAGSMGLVYACKDLELSGRIVAVKVLFPEIDQDKVAAQRFRNEVFAAYDVSHPNVVRAYEFIRDGEMVAYTMEYVNGGDLATRLASQKTIPIPEVISILSQMCLGVQAIHDAQIIHRDLKPENIMLTKDGVVKIADFGIARLGHGSKLTEHGGVVGTIDYVSPEYMLNSQVDWRSDIYAMGVLAYEMLAGVAPFRGDSVYATMTKRLKSDPEPISKYRHDCPPELEKIVLHAMARDPEKRFQSAYEMFEELQKISGDTSLLHVHQNMHNNVGSHNNGIENIVEYVGRVSEDEKLKDNQIVSARKENTGVTRTKNNTYSFCEEKTVSDQIIPRKAYGTGNISQIEEVQILDLYQSSNTMGSIESLDGTFLDDYKTTTTTQVDVSGFDFYRDKKDTAQSSISLEEVQKNAVEHEKKEKDYKMTSYKIAGIIVFILIILGLVGFGMSLAKSEDVDETSVYNYVDF